MESHGRIQMCLSQKSITFRLMPLCRKKNTLTFQWSDGIKDRKLKILSGHNLKKSKYTSYGINICEWGKVYCVACYDAVSKLGKDLELSPMIEFWLSRGLGSGRRQIDGLNICFFCPKQPLCHSDAFWVFYRLASVTFNSNQIMWRVRLCRNECKAYTCNPGCLLAALEMGKLLAIIQLYLIWL